jgi:2-keto-4-pentenoate hydratase/2-oxohepta-3-ene-1,7-dioic acid hydratase in catechol pathway
MKATSTMNGPNDDVMLPKGSEKGDWEVELGIVIGTTARYVAEKDWLKHVAGFCIVNDVSERDFQMNRGGQWTKGKSCDTFCPTGPWLVTPDEIADPQALDVLCEVSGEAMQKSNTRNMIFSCATIVSYISQFMTLEPGDLIPTGTPAGVGLGRGRFLKPGDTMRLAIAGLGEQRQKVVSFG